MKVDSYLLHATRAFLDDADAAQLGEAVNNDPRPTPRMPMLLQVDPTRFDASLISDLEVSTMIGAIVAGSGTQATLASLESDTTVISVEASRGATIENLASSVAFARGDAVHRPPISEDGSAALVAVIDGGIDILHECFTDDAGASRVEALWDQTDPTGPSPAASSLGYPAGLSYGTLHTRAMIDSYIAAAAVPPKLGRDTVTGHGTHVASIAAGRAVGPFAGGMAPGARIVFVRPKTTVTPGDPSSIGYSVSHAAALSFIAHTADTLDLPVAVNVSQGMNAGAHDGTSLLEAAFDGFSEGGRRPGRVIIKSAGNERLLGGHARADVSTGVSVDLQWDSQLPHKGPDNIEVWYAAADDLRFRLHAPNGEVSGWVDWTTPNVSGAFKSGERFDISLDRWFRDNGDSRLLATLSTSGQISSGKFKLEVTGQKVVAGGRLDAWIERDNTRPIRFDVNVEEDGTLSVPGTARTVITVASVDHHPTVRSSDFSSKGPARDARFKPDLSAPGRNIEAAKGGTTRGTKTMSGTSMAAPHVTGAVALALSRQKRTAGSEPNAMQIGSALRGTAQNISIIHSSALGFGVLDAAAFVIAF